MTLFQVMLPSSISKFLFEEVRGCGFVSLMASSKCKKKFFPPKLFAHESSCS